MSADRHAPLVLVADDEPLNLDAVAQILEQAGYGIATASSGDEALRRARQRRPDLILLDMLMPGMDGRATCAALRDIGFSDIPVICVTGLCEERVMVDAFSAGAVDYITKPVVAQELLARIRTHLDLKMARDRLAEMLQEREEVMHVVAHDLKNPISAALFAAQLLRDTAMAERRRDLLDDIVSSTERALQLIQRFLAGSSDGQRLRAESDDPIELHALAARVARAQRPTAEARGMDIAVRGNAVARANPTIAESVVHGLVSNAIRYAPRDSRVDVEIDVSRTGRTRLLVMDRGPGISDALRGLLFRKYAQLISAVPVTSTPHSSGLGLAIAKRDVARMGGHLWYEPRPGGGAVFGIELPQAAHEWSPACQSADAA